MGAILNIVSGLVAAWNKFAQAKQQAHDEENGSNKVTVINQQKVMDNVEIAQHIEHDVPIDGALAKWVREREAATRR